MMADPEGETVETSREECRSDFVTLSVERALRSVMMFVLVEVLAWSVVVT